MKQKTILRAVLAAVLSLVATAASAHDFEVDGIYYKYNGDGTVSVTYKGLSFSQYDGEYTGKVVIPSSVTYSGTTYSVTSISNYAFAGGCSGLTSVSIPNSVTSIGNSAFEYCSGLTSVSIPNSVTSIGDYAFYECSGLTSVSIPNSVTSIGNFIFNGCTSLESIVVESGNSKYDSRDNCNAIIETATNTLLAGCKNTTIPNSVTSIGDSAFSGCSGLTSVTIPNSVTSIGDWAFSGCSGLTRVDISSIKAWLGIKFADYDSNPLSYAQHLYLNGEEVKDLVIPNSVTSIGYKAFAGCSGLTSVSIPNSVNSIGDRAFWGCSGLTSVTIPNSVTSIGDYSFYQCSGLTTIFYNAENCADVTANSYVFGYIYRSQNIIIGKEVKKVPNYLFYSLGNAPTSVISQSVTPPACGENTFNSDAYTAKLYVPSDAVFSYQFADVWSKFSSINGLDKPITGITLSESDVTLKVNETKTITASITPADATIPDAYYWTSSNSNVATVNDDGVVTAVAGGTAVISANSCDGGDVVATCNVTVKSNKATSISLSATELKIAKNGTATLTYTILPEDAEVKTAEWIVSDASVLIYKLNDDGSILIGGKSEGTATVTARTTDGSNLEATCVVSVGAGAVEGVDTAAARIYTANGNIIIAATEDGEAAIYDFTGRLIKSVPVASGNSTAVPVTPGYYIVKTGTKTQSVIVK